MLGFEQFFVNLRAKTLLFQSYAFDEIHIVMPFVSMKVDRGGKMNLLGVVPASEPDRASPEGSKEPASSGAAKPLEIGLLKIDQGIVDHYVVFGALVGAMFWNVVTWLKVIPSSSSHALIGGLVGAGVAHAGFTGVHWGGLNKTLIAIVLSPTIGMFLALLVMLLSSWALKGSSSSQAEKSFRAMHLVSSAAYSLSHGLNDAQKTMGIITVLLYSTGYLSGEFEVPHWVAIACYIAIAMGTATGGWRIIETMGLKRSDVYIGNILKCRPDTPGQSSGNRKPTPSEMQTCIPYLHEQIDLIQPKVIVALGATAVEGLLGKTIGITKLRGNWRTYRGIPLMPTYHPAYLLRSAADKAKIAAWAAAKNACTAAGASPIFW